MLKSKSLGFTRAELLAVILMMALMGLYVKPGGAISRESVSAAVCQNNLRALMRAWQMYANDNGEYLPPNPPFPDQSPGRTPYRYWVGGNMQFTPDTTNTALITDPRYCSLAPYIGGNRFNVQNAKVFRCPADNSPPPYGKRSVGLRVRSVSMNGAIGTNPDVKGGKMAVDAPWLDGVNHTVGKTYRTFGRLADMIAPKPSELFVIIDEDNSTLDDGAFAFEGPLPKKTYLGFNAPGTRHDFGATIGFADGRAEIHPWQETNTRNNGSFPWIQTGSVDFDWLATHGSALLKR